MTKQKTNELYYSTNIDGKPYLNVLGPDGVLQNSYHINNNIFIFCLSDKLIYYLFAEGNNFALAKYSTETQSSAPVCSIENFSYIKKMEMVNDKIYFIGNHNDYINTDYTLANANDIFKYYGERISCVDPYSGKIEDINIDFPVMLSANPDNRHLLIYAYDETKGYYLIVYDTENKSFSEKYYHNLKNISELNVCNEKNDFLYPNVNRSPMSLSLASISHEKGSAELLPARFIRFIKSNKDYTFFIDGSAPQKIIRIKTASYLYGNKKITMLHSIINEADTPFGCGYIIENKYLRDEELAINILSQERSYDICLMDSVQTISDNVRNKGAFYPLNDVDGVKEYLDTCFPYIKECAINEDGDIWMLPINVRIPFFVYNEELCNKYGMQLSGSMTADYFYKIIDQIKKDNSLKELYHYYPGRITYYMFYQYLRESRNFDTDIFRNLARNIKQFDNEFDGNPESNMGNGNLPFSINMENNKDVLLCFYWDARNIFEVYSSYSSLRACNLPYLTDNKTNVASCYFLFVNPASKNLKEALQYISTLCHYLTSDINNPNFIFKDRSKYPDSSFIDDLYEIYANGDIRFTYPEELFINDFEKYLKGEKDLDSFIKDSNKRLDIYLNE